MSAIETKLAVKGGVARFENDGYMRTSTDVVGNAWFICTLWLAEYYIAASKATSDLEKPLAILKQVALQARPSGVLAEQLDPSTGEHASVSPLTWSHSTYVAAVQNYLRRANEIR
jgi:glucoamylase